MRSFADCYKIALPRFQSRQWEIRTPVIRSLQTIFKAEYPWLLEELTMGHARVELTSRGSRPRILPLN